MSQLLVCIVVLKSLFLLKKTEWEWLIKFRQKIISQNVFDSFSLYKKANISFNYGTFYKTLLEELSKTSDKYNSTLNEILKSENIQDYTSNLLKLNDMLEIDQNCDILKENANY